MSQEFLVIDFGCMSPKLSIQLRGRISRSDGANLNHLAECLAKLHAAKIINDAERAQAESRIVVKAQSYIRQHAASKEQS